MTLSTPTALSEEHIPNRDHGYLRLDLKSPKRQADETSIDCSTRPLTAQPHPSVRGYQDTNIGDLGARICRDPLATDRSGGRVAATAAVERGNG
ncbi:hypothetical protein ACPPVO_34970 [Dactylosporangium sp. McL0621]|uniref:hypothetical protein n=1 Tax=Dactylosporangium sp. McL0621 TaxID=3415678 RepID=UPI003CF87414